MEKIIDLLHSGGYSCVIGNGAEIRTFTQLGVADLYDLFRQEPSFMKGAILMAKTLRDKLIPYTFVLPALLLLALLRK